MTLLGQKINQYTFIERKGLSMHVYGALNEETKEKVIVKVFATSLDESDQKVLDAEIKIGMRISRSCVFLVRYEEVIMKQDQCFVIMEYCAKGDLAQIISDRIKTDDFFSDEDIFCFILHTGNAVLTLHKEDIVHRDLKPENVFLTERGLYKVGDFGISRKIDTTHNKTTVVMASLGYASPETLDGDDKLSKGMDIYSLGYIILEMIDLRHPFATNQNVIQQSRVFSGRVNEPRRPLSHALKPVRDFALLMVSMNPTQRPPIESLVSLPVIFSFTLSQYISGLSALSAFPSASVKPSSAMAATATAAAQVQQLQKERDQLAAEVGRLTAELKRERKGREVPSTTASASASASVSPPPSAEDAASSTGSAVVSASPASVTVNLPVKLIHNNSRIKVIDKLGGCIIDFNFCTGSVVIDLPLKGVNKMIVSVTNTGGIKFAVGAVETESVTRVLGVNTAYKEGIGLAAVFGYSANGLMTIINCKKKTLDFRKVKEEFDKKRDVIVAVELNCDTHTLHFFMNNQLVEAYVAGVPAGCRLMFSGYSSIVDVVSLQQLDKPSITAGQTTGLKKVMWN